MILKVLAPESVLNKYFDNDDKKNPKKKPKIEHLRIFVVSPSPVSVPKCFTTRTKNFYLFFTLYHIY